MRCHSSRGTSQLWKPADKRAQQTALTSREGKLIARCWADRSLWKSEPSQTVAQLIKRACQEHKLCSSALQRTAGMNLESMKVRTQHSEAKSFTSSAERATTGASVAVAARLRGTEALSEHASAQGAPCSWNRMSICQRNTFLASRAHNRSRPSQALSQCQLQSCA